MGSVTKSHSIVREIRLCHHTCSLLKISWENKIRLGVTCALFLRNICQPGPVRWWGRAGGGVIFLVQPPPLIVGLANSHVAPRE